MDRTDFLEPGFDPTTLKVAELRGILHSHDIDFASNAKKSELVQIFNDQLVPKAADLLRVKSEVEPRGSGIVDAPRKRTRSLSPAKASVSKREPASPKKPSRRTKTEDVVQLENAPLLLAPPGNVPEASPSTDSPASPRKGRKKLSTKTIVDPNAKELEEQRQQAVPVTVIGSPRKRTKKKKEEEETEKKEEEEKPIVDSSAKELEEQRQQAVPVTAIGSPRKRTKKKEEEEIKKKEEEEKLAVKDKREKEAKEKKSKKKDEDIKKDTKESPAKAKAESPAKVESTHTDSIKPSTDSSPFSRQNVFQQSSSPQSSGRTPELSPTSTKSSKKRSLAESAAYTLTPAKKRASKINEPGTIQQLSPQIRVTSPKSPIRHFSNFPSSPEEPKYQSQPQSQVNTPQADFPTPESHLRQQEASRRSDHTFTGKRLSFMPSLSNLRLSNKFLEQLQQEAAENEHKYNLTPLDPNAPVPVVRETEITQEEELKKLETELENEKRRIHVSNEKRRKAAQQSEAGGLSWTNLFVVLLLTVFTAYSVWWCKERFEIGYCDVNFVPHSRTEKGEQPAFEQYLDYIKPSCVPCPNHSTCYPNFKAVCDEDFLYRPNIFSLGGRLPFAPACLPDTEKQRRIQALAKHARLVLREQNAKAECRGNVPAGIEENELHTILKNLKSPYLSDEEFEELWKHAIKDVENDEEVIVRRIRLTEKGFSPTNSAPDIVIAKKVLQSTSLANISFECRVRKAIGGLVVRYHREASLLGSLVASAVGIKWYLNRRRAYHERIAKLAKQSLLQLSAQQRLADEDTSGQTVRYIAVSSLRDSILPGVKSTDRLWSDVAASVEEHVNVRSRNTEIHGEIMKIWEWVGGEVN